ncbi:hypothetical protein MAR_020616, partial [Mya arenaria]
MKNTDNHITVPRLVVSIAGVNLTLSKSLKMDIIIAYILLVYATSAAKSPTYAAFPTEERNLYGTLTMTTDQQLHGDVILRLTPNFERNISVVWKYLINGENIARTVSQNDTNFRLYENGSLYLMLINASIGYNGTYFWVEQLDRKKVMSPFIQLILTGNTNNNGDADDTLFPLVLSTTIGICVVFLLFIGNLIFFITAFKKT